MFTKIIGISFLKRECDRTLGEEPESPAEAQLTVGESVIKCPSPLNVLKYTYDS
jgi:hypothetical protein